jgi:hypothetical protein
MLGLGAERAFPYANGTQLLRVANMGQHIFCADYLRDFYRFLLRVDGKPFFAAASSSEALSDIVDRPSIIVG